MGNKVTEFNGLSTDSVILAIRERVAELLPGRTVGEAENFGTEGVDYYTVLQIHSAYHIHTLTFYNAIVKMHIEHKLRKRFKANGPETEEGAYNLADPDSLDKLFDDIVETSTHDL